jgi:hypothetical protein
MRQQKASTIIRGICPRDWRGILRPKASRMYPVACVTIRYSKIHFERTSRFTLMPINFLFFFCLHKVLPENAYRRDLVYLLHVSFLKLNWWQFRISLVLSAYEINWYGVFNILTVRIGLLRTLVLTMIKYNYINFTYLYILIRYSPQAIKPSRLM